MHNVKEIKKVIDLGDGKPITIESGKLAKQAHGSVTIRLGDTILLATVVSNQEPADVPFLPLTVDYREKYAAAGRYPGGFFKREARPSNAEILTMRLVDRALRPLFPDDYHSETQVMISLMSADRENIPDSLACLAASSALAVSDIPFGGPVSEVCIARKDGKHIINPTYEEQEGADINLIVAGTEDNIVMVEGEMNEVQEDEMVEAIQMAHSAIKVHCRTQKELAEEKGTADQTREYKHEETDEDLEKKVHEACYDGCYAIAKEGYANKEERKEALDELLSKFRENISEEELAEKEGLVKNYFKEVQNKAIRDMVLADRVRMDGRQLDEIRPIWCEVDYLPGTHGSAIFTRGETQSLTTLTLGSKNDEQTIDGAMVTGSETFMLHYNFPPFCTGEAKPIRGTSRREVGHGNLAHRAISPVIPGPPENPYTIRLVSDILESNGSSSMATVCAATLALMDGGMPITAPVSGIAMGLISDLENPDRYAVLSDILGDEDHLGDMDFKVTGTRKGLTACQMDIKIDGLSYEVLKKALEQSKAGRIHILDKIEETLPQPREDYKPHAPRIETFYIPNDMIGAIIGPGGKIIQEIQAETNTEIVVDETPEGGRVDLVSNNKEDIDAARSRIKKIAFPPTAEVGQEYEGKVKSVMPYGAFVEVVPGTDGLIHISEMEHYRVNKVEDVMKEGDMVKFKITGKDPKTGKLKLSRKVLLPKPEEQSS